MSMKEQYKFGGEVEEFVNYLQKHRRYILDNKWKEFIKKINDSSKGRIFSITKNSKLYRARIGRYPLKKMGAPPIAESRDGRISPIGIRCLYLASDERTAIAEIRPWKKMDGTIATVVVTKDVMIVDATGHLDKAIDRIIESRNKPDILNESRHIEYMNWGMIDQLFSQPVSPGERMPAYVATQYLAEVFKESGFDGVKYKSSFNKEGYNIALFDTRVARLTDRYFFNIQETDFEYRVIN